MAIKSCECWVVVTPEYERVVNYQTGRKGVRKIKATKIFQSRPSKTAIGNGIAVKITLEIEDIAFQPIEPKVRVAVPINIEDDIEIEVEPVAINLKGKAMQR